MTNFDNITAFVINLPQRVDRYKEFKEQLKWINDKPTYIMEGQFDKPAFKGIGAAHTNCIWYANEKGLDEVLIMEDDIVFQGEAKTYPYLLEALENLPEEWDVLLGGIYEKNKTTHYNKHWDSVQDFCALHFYIVNKCAYEKLLTYDGMEHFDRWMSRQNLRIFVTKKYIAHQKDGYSDNVGAEVEYNKQHLNHSKLL